MCGPRRYPSQKRSKRKRRKRFHPQATYVSSNQKVMDTGVKTGNIYCFHCRSTLQSEDFVDLDKVNYCQNCGNSLATCDISKNKFYTGDEFAQCPNCLHVFHSHHLMDWLKSNNQCPTCRQPISEIIRGTVGLHNLID